MALLKKSAARKRVFSFVGLSLASLSVQVSKDGGSFNSASLTNITGNFYYVSLSGSDTDTLGDLAYLFTDSVLGVVAPNGDDVDQVVTDLPGDTVSSVTGNVAGDVAGNVAGNLGGSVGGSVLGTVVGGVPSVGAPVDVSAGSFNDLLDNHDIEATVTLRQSLRLILAALAGKLSVSGNTVTIRDVQDAKNRITATTDASGQRTAMTYNVS